VDAIKKSRKVCKRFKSGDALGMGTGFNGIQEVRVPIVYEQMRGDGYKIEN